MSIFRTEYTVEAVSADAMGFLAKLQQAGVCVSNVVSINELKLQFSIAERFYWKLVDIADKSGTDLRIVSKKGLRVLLHHARTRWMLIAGIALLTVFTLYLPTRILFVSVEGNQYINTTEILDKAEVCGISFGASRKEVRSERMKNALLQSVPELKWAGINTYGCTAVISVLERNPVSQENTESTMVRGIYASRDGIIRSVTATKGTALCKPGQAVQAGELLISGYTDCGLLTRAEQAEGEVYALTQRILTGISPDPTALRSEIENESVYYSLQLGKKRIKLYNDSGNLAPCCGKIYKTVDLTLPGGFKLPVSLIIERTQRYDTVSVMLQQQDDRALCSLAASYIADAMVAGEIAAQSQSVTRAEDAVLLQGTYACIEMIGQLQDEEIK